MNYLWAQLTVEKVMSRGVITVHPEDLILDVAQIMLDRKVSGLPVLDEHGYLVGIITESDIFRMLVETRTPAVTPNP
jgi:acetoin utilization protein AcuB